MDSSLVVLLQEYGLDQNEIKVFLYLVGNKELTAYMIAKQTRINRSTCYDVLKRLAIKGFVSAVEKGAKSYYYASGIGGVVSKLKDKEIILLSIMPKLQNLEEKQETRVRLLEGIDGQKQFNFDLFTSAKNKHISFCYAIGSGYASSLSSNIFIEKLIEELKKLKLNKRILYKGIWAERFRGDRLILRYNHLGENRFIEKLPSRVGVIISDVFVAFLYTTDQPYVIEIKNRMIAEEFRIYFENLWTLSKK